jgi:hypothetical protein
MIMPFRNRLFAPSRKAHLDFGNAIAAARSFAFGGGGLSSTKDPEAAHRASPLLRSPADGCRSRAATFLRPVYGLHRHG